MFNRRRLSSVLAVAAVALMLAPVFVVGAPAPASALAVACPPGAPPNSSYCTPSGWSIFIDQGWASVAQARAAGVVLPAASGVAASAAGTAGPTLAAAVAGMGGLVVTQKGIDGFDLDVDLDQTTLTLVSNNVGYTFPGGRVSFDVAANFDAGVMNVTVTAASATWTDSNLGGSQRFKNIREYFSGDPDLSSSVVVEYEAVDALGTVLATGNAFGRSLYSGYSWREYATDTYFDHISVDTVLPVGTVAVLFDLSVKHLGGDQFSWSTDDVEAPGFAGVLTSQLQCQGPIGGPRSFQTSQAVTLTADNSTIEFPGAECDAGEVLSSLVVEWVTDTGNETLYEYTAPEWVTDIPVEFPGCVDGDCGMTLWRVFSDAPAEWCGGAAVGCPNWWQDANKLDHYECRYGDTSVGLGSCSMYRNPGTITPNTSIHVDADGNLVGSTVPVTSLDPADYEDLDKIIIDVTVPVEDPDIGQAVDVGFGCMPDGWGKFNPIEWVARPVGCALAWAFIPEPGAFVDGVNETLGDSILGQVGTEIDAFGTITWPSGSTSCEPLYRGTPSVFKGVEVVITPCGDIPTALSSVIRPLLSGLFWIGGLFLSVTAILQAFDVDLMIGRQGKASS